MGKYDQLKLFDDTTYNALVHPRHEPWDEFVNATKSATFNEQTIIVKPVRKKKSRKKSR